MSARPLTASIKRVGCESHELKISGSKKKRVGNENPNAVARMPPIEPPAVAAMIRWSTFVMDGMKMRNAAKISDAISTRVVLIHGPIPVEMEVYANTMVEKVAKTAVSRMVSNIFGSRNRIVVQRSTNLASSAICNNKVVYGVRFGVTKIRPSFVLCCAKNSSHVGKSDKWMSGFSATNIFLQRK